MTNKPLHNSLIDIQKLSYNEDYYQGVFKKSERIVAAVFYILSHIEDSSKTHVHYTALSDRAFALQTVALASLDIDQYAAATELHTLLQALVALESTVRIATAARVLSGELELTLITEIESLERYLRNHYLSGQVITNSNPTSSLSSAARRSPAPAARVRRQRPQIPAGDLSSDAVMVYSELSDRTERIKTVLEAKPEATIKDLSDIITDVSAKTIQRDLNSLIERGDVVRHGERRWSKYSVKG